MLSGIRPMSTTRSGNLLKVMRPKASAAKQSCRTTAVRSQHSDPRRDEQPSCRCGDPAENVLNDSKVCVLEIQRAKRETNCPGYQHEAGDSGECAAQASQLGPHTDRDPDNVGSGHELAKAYDIGKFLLAYPPAPLDGDAARPDEPATEAAERDGEERSEQRCQRNGSRQVPLCHHLVAEPFLPDTCAPIRPAACGQSSKMHSHGRPD